MNLIESNLKIGIHHRKGSYSEHWIDYCEKENINYKIVNAYSSKIIDELNDCDIFMWHHSHCNPKDVLFAKQLLFSLEGAGKIVYPDFSTGWHFDDKVGQKYLMESHNIPLIKSYIFYTKEEAIEWTGKTDFPKVFKLRGGAGSSNVKLIKSPIEALSIIKTAFGRGFRQYDPYEIIRDNLSNYKKSKINFNELIKAFTHIFYPFQVERAKGREKGYVYFQDFIPECKYDIRVQVIGDRCYAMKRFVRKNDFRASGSGNIEFDGSKIPVSAISLSFAIAKILKMQTIAIDLLPYKNSFLVTEICFCYGIADGELDYGYWDNCMNWYPGIINPFGWMIDNLIASLTKTNKMS